MISSLLLLKSIIAGMLLCIPFGPAGIICLRRTISSGARSGFISGMGMVLAHIIFGALAVLSFAGLAGFVDGYQVTIRLIGGTLIALVGLRSLLGPPLRIEPICSPGKMLRTFSSTLLIVIANPSTIIAILAIFSAFGLAGSAPDHRSALVLLLGISIGGILMWIGVSWSFHRYHSRLGPKTINRLYRGSGVLVIAFGFLFIIQSLTLLLSS